MMPSIALVTNTNQISNGPRAARRSRSPCALPLNRDRHFHRTPGMVDVGQIYSCSGIKFNTTVAKNYGWSHGKVESKGCEQDTAPVAAAQSGKSRTVDAPTWCCNHTEPRSELKD